MNANNYLISIIIPNHGVPANIFKRCFDSIKNQTLGFEKIELIIVIHNSSDIANGIKELVRGYSNVKVIIANNEARTPSSPRNIGIKNATGEIIAFVDADDWIPLDCLRPVLTHMQDKSIDIGITRRDYSLEDETATPVTNIVLWDQTQETIIMNRDNIDNEKMFSGFWGTSTSKFYRRDFLINNHILFDETILFSEDFYFNVIAFNASKKICVMPQIITYHYFINHDSLVQSSNKTPETLIHYAEGFKKIFDKMIECGFWIDDTVCNMCFYFALFIVKNNILTYDDRIKIKSILEPYLKTISPLKPSKLYSKKEVRDFYNFPNDVILNVDKWMKNDEDDNFSSILDTSKLMGKEQNVLNSIIESNMDTDIGKRFGFADIYSFSQYALKVPLSNYDVYKPFIDLTSKVCESGIYSSEKPSEYLYSTGSFDLIKALPCNLTHINTYIEHLKKILDNKNTYYVYSGVYQFLKYNDTNYLISIYGSMLNHYFIYLMNNGMFLDKEMLNYFKNISDKETLDIEYTIAVLDIYEENVTQIFAANTFTLFRAFKNIKDNFLSICNDIANGTIRNKEKMNNARLLQPNKKRAAYLRKIYNKKKGNISLKDIWPKLTLIECYHCGNYQIYTDHLKQNLHGVTFKNSLLYTPEAMIGIASDNNGHYKLNLDGAFFEFIKIDDDSHRAYRYKQLEKGKVYQLVITNYAGLYRYLSKYYILVDHYEGDDLIFSLYTLNKNSVKIMNACLSNDAMYEALLKTCIKTKFNINDYAFYYENNILNLYIDPVDDTLINKNICQMFKLELEKQLEKLVDNFKEAKEKEIKNFDVIFLESNTILLSYEKRAIKGKTSINALKIRHLINNISSLNYLDKFKILKV